MSEQADWPMNENERWLMAKVTERGMLAGLMQDAVEFFHIALLSEGLRSELNECRRGAAK